MIVDINQSQTYTVTTTSEPYLFKVLLANLDTVKAKNLSFGGQDIKIKLLDANMDQIHNGDDPIAGDDAPIEVEFDGSSVVLNYGETSEESISVTSNGYAGYLYFEVVPFNESNTEEFTVNIEITVPLRIVYRLTKGTPLTAEEHDNNLNALLERIGNSANTGEQIQPIIPTYGTSEERPYTGGDGQFYFDQTLNKPIWFFPSWGYYMDATGANV